MQTPPDSDIDEQPPRDDGSTFDMRFRSNKQGQLFTNEDLVIPASLRSMRKAVAAIHAIPIKPEHQPSLNGRRLFDACIIIAQIEFRKRGQQAVEQVKSERISPIFEIRVTEMARLAGIPGKNYERIYEDLDNLFEMALHWNIVGEDASVQWEMKSHFLSSLGYGRAQKRGLIRFSIDPAILAIVLEPSSWAQLSLQAQSGLGTAASYSLYQNTFRYINTNAKVTAALPLTTWMELLAGNTRYVEVDSQGNKIARNYGDFKRRTLLDAIRRVNEIPALGYTLELREIKSGIRVTKLQFKFIPKQTDGFGIPLTWPTDIIMALESLGLSSKEIEDMGQAQSYEIVAEALVKLKEAEVKIRAAGKHISSRRSYFLGILSNLAAGSEIDDADHERLEAEIKVAEAQRASQARQERLRDEFQMHKSDQFARAVFEMGEGDRAKLFDDFEATSQGHKTKLLLSKGWSPKNAGALSILRSWMGTERIELLDHLLPNPEDSIYEAWLAWRLDNNHG